MRKVAFLAEAFSQFNHWAIEDRKTYTKIIELIKDIDRNPFSGLGKPEPLKYELQGYWSRRITNSASLGLQGLSRRSSHHYFL
jgi:toxin YoeB